MNRPTRTILLVGLVAIVGVSALALLADRYRRMSPMKSVADLEAEVAAGSGEQAQEGPVGSLMPDLAAAPEPTGPGGDGSSDDNAEPRGPDERIDAFAAVRSAVKRQVDEKEWIADRSLDKETGRFRTEMPQGTWMEFEWFRMELRVIKGRALRDAGTTYEEYEATREAIRKWMAGDEDVDPSMKAALDARREEIVALDLGRYDPFDAEVGGYRKIK